MHLKISSGKWRRFCLGLNVLKVYVNHGVMTWKHFPQYWPFVRGIHRSPVDSLHKGSVIRWFVIFVVDMNKLLKKQTSCRRFETSWRSCDVTVIQSWCTSQRWINKATKKRSKAVCLFYRYIWDYYTTSDKTGNTWFITGNYKQNAHIPFHTLPAQNGRRCAEDIFKYIY